MTIGAKKACGPNARPEVRPAREKRRIENRSKDRNLSPSLSAGRSRQGEKLNRGKKKRDDVGDVAELVLEAQRDKKGPHSIAEKLAFLRKTQFRREATHES